MRGEPDVASIAALIGDPSRTAMLTALADGRALPAGELATAAGLSLSGASAQLARLTKGGLLTVEREGRHRYYRLAGPHVAAALEGLALLAVTPQRARARSPAAEALRRARTCYDHLAGNLGVALAKALEDHGLVMAGEGKRLEVTTAGRSWFLQVLEIETARVGCRPAWYCAALPGLDRTTTPYRRPFGCRSASPVLRIRLGHQRRRHEGGEAFETGLSSTRSCAEDIAVNTDRPSFRRAGRASAV